MRSLFQMINSNFKVPFLVYGAAFDSSYEYIWSNAEK